MTTTYRETEHPRGADGKWAPKSLGAAHARPRTRGGRHRRRPGLRFAAVGAGVSTLTVILLGWQATMQLLASVLLVVLAVTEVVLVFMLGKRAMRKVGERSPGSLSGSLSPARRKDLRWWHFSRRMAHALKRRFPWLARVAEEHRTGYARL